MSAITPRDVLRAAPLSYGPSSAWGTLWGAGFNFVPEALPEDWERGSDEAAAADLRRARMAYATVAERKDGEAFWHLGYSVLDGEPYMICQRGPAQWSRRTILNYEVYARAVAFLLDTRARAIRWTGFSESERLDAPDPKLAAFWGLVASQGKDGRIQLGVDSSRPPGGPPDGVRAVPGETLEVIEPLRKGQVVKKLILRTGPHAAPLTEEHMVVVATGESGRIYLPLMTDWQLEELEERNFIFGTR